MRSRCACALTRELYLDIRPILAALTRHRTAALLIVLEIALSCAIICNAVFIIGERISNTQRSSGIVEDDMVSITTSSLLPDGSDEARRQQDLRTLLAVPGVVAASSVNQVPYGDNVWASGISLAPDQQRPTVHASNYMDDGSLLATFGLRLREGRPFTADEYIENSAMQAEAGRGVPVVLLTASLARRLFPQQSALGKDIYIWGGKPTRVVGVTDDLMVPGRDSSFLSPHDSMILPVRVANGGYALRTAPGQADAVLQAAVKALLRDEPNRLVESQATLATMRDTFYRRDRAVIWLLASVCIALLAVTAFGVVGLASFWVQQRTRQIGIRRALGATRRDILRYFQLENFLLTSLGVVLGLLLAYALNLLLMERYELARLPLMYLPASAVLLWLLGQVAVLGPARRAAAIAPAVATRSA